MRRTVAQSLDNHLSSLPIIQRKEQIEAIRELLFAAEMDTILEESRKPTQTQIVCCPECGSVTVVKYGRSRGRQRYLCRDCEHSFTERLPRNLISTSKLSKATWMRYIGCFVDGLSIKKCSEKCGISPKTAYTMRLRILDLLAQTQDNWVLRNGEKAQIDETFTYESFKGNRTKCSDFEMPRPAYKRGRKRDKRHKMGAKSSQDSICILTGVDEQRRTFLEVVSRSMMTAAQCETALASRVAAGGCIITDELAAYVGTRNTLGLEHVTYNTQHSGGNLNAVNSLHSHFKSFLNHKRGVSTRRLPLYLAEFSWRWSTCMNDDDQFTTKRIVTKIAETAFENTLVTYTADPYPFIEWWETKAGKLAQQKMLLDEKQRDIDCAFHEAGDNEELLAVVKERQLAHDEQVRALNLEIDERKTQRFVKAVHRRQASIGKLQKQS